MNIDSVKITCPNCHQYHEGIEDIQAPEGLGDQSCGFGVCAGCAAIFAMKIKGDKAETHALSVQQLNKIAEIMPQTYADLMHTSSVVKKKNYTNRIN